MESKEAVMPLSGHLSELRRRLLISLAMLAVGMIISNVWLDEIMAFLTAPAGKLYFMKPAEAFFIYFKVMLTAGAILTAPVLFYEFWAFLVPAFTAREKTTLMVLVPSSLVLFLTGIAFSWFIVLPQGLRFFLTFSSDFVQPMLSMESYLNFVFMLVLPFGVLFNLPLVLIVLAKLDFITSAMLVKKRKYIILLAFIAAAVITPTTDILSQCLLALPMIALLEISRLIIRYGLHR